MAGGWWQLRAGKVLHRSLKCRHASYGAVGPGTERCQPVEWTQSARVASVGAQLEETAVEEADMVAPEAAKAAAASSARSPDKY